MLSDEAAYMKGLLESMLPRAFPKMFVDWNAIAADHVAEHMTTTLVVASALDGGCSDGWSVGCQKTLISIISSACPRDGGEGMRCLIIVAVSVPWDMTALPHALSSVGLNYRSALLLHAATAPELLPQKIRSLHLPVAASSFGERDAQKFSPMLLLSSSAERERKAGTLGDTNDEETTILARKHMFAAYLYYRCDRLDREEFFDALNMESGGRVSALGRCRGRSESFDNDETDTRSTKATFMTRRFSRTRHDDSVALYAPYRFVVAFENHPDTHLITGRTLDMNGIHRKNYPNQSRKLSFFNSAKTGTVEMAIRVNQFRLTGIYFDEQFGSGSENFLGDEYIFITDALKLGIRCQYLPIDISMHEEISSGVIYGSTEDAQVRSAVFSRVFGRKASLVKIAFLSKNLTKFRKLSLIRAFLGINRK